MLLRDLQLNELELLNECIKIFDEYNLRYFILGGTFLGAIRHKGFIPWDDDIDIGMPRSDYEKFISIAKEKLPNYIDVQYFLNTPTSNNYFLKVINKNISFTREDRIEKDQIVNLWIDIFPLDGMPNNKIKRMFHKFSLLTTRLFYQYSRFNNGVNIKKKRPAFEKILIKFGFIFCKFIKLDTRKQLNKLDKKLKKYSYDKSNYVVNFMGAYKFKEMFPRKYYDFPVSYEFENTTLIGASEYDKILKQMYGDYMTPPKNTQRFSHSLNLK